MDDDQRVVVSYGDGREAPLAVLREWLREGSLPACISEVLARPRVHLCDEPQTPCLDCPLAPSSGEHGALTARMAHAGQVYGVLGVSLPRHFAQGEEERALLEEVAGDLGHALRALEEAAERRQAEQALSRLDRFACLILDDIGYAKRSNGETGMLFELIGHRYETRSLIITSNHPFADWEQIFEDKTMTVAAEGHLRRIRGRLSVRRARDSSNCRSVRLG